MKNILSFAAVTLLVCSISFQAKAYDDSSYDRDITDIWLSWCDKDNVISAASSGSVTVIKENCAAIGKRCQDGQSTRGRFVYYFASCQEKQVKEKEKPSSDGN